MNFEEGFLKDTIKRLRYYKDLGDKTFEQLEEKDFRFRPSEESNSTAIIIQHMHGNMMSRFTNFLTEDGEKPWRKRDAEFEVIVANKAELLSLWSTGWNCALQALESLQPADLIRTVYIRTEPLTVYDALLRFLAHSSYHIGQIVYLGKMIKDSNWKTLSIPKRQSNQFNEQIAPIK